MGFEARLTELGLSLPEPANPGTGFATSFAWTRSRGNRVYVAGHGAFDPDGRPAGPFGKFPSEVSVETATEAARQTGLAILASLKQEVGDPDRIAAWLMVWGTVNADPGFPNTTQVINGFSDVILAVFGDEVGRHARMALGVAALPLNSAVVIWAEVEVDTAP
jgi:enamine deaminase RidA (YjgF/YER057c/UK114 family)